MEPSFVPSVIDQMLGVPDGASVATMRILRHRLGIWTRVMSRRPVITTGAEIMAELFGGS